MRAPAGGHTDWLTAIWIVLIGLSASVVYSRLTDVAVKPLIRRWLNRRDERDVSGH